MQANRLRRQLTNCSIKSIPVEAIDDDLCHAVREILKKEQKENPDKMDAADIQHYVADFRYLRRFLQRSGKNQDKACALVRGILIWRKEQNLPKFTYESFPSEMYRLKVAKMNKFDLNGNLCVYGMAKYFIKDDDFKQLFIPFVTFMYYKALDVVVERGSECGFTVITDTSGVTFSQYDLSFALWGVDLVANKLPSALRKMFIVDMPWFAKPVFKTVLAFVPGEWRNVIRISSPKDLNKYIGSENMASFFGIEKDTLADPNILKVGDRTLIDLTKMKSLADFTEEEMILIGLKPEKRKKYMTILDQLKKVDDNELKEREKKSRY